VVEHLVTSAGAIETTPNHPFFTTDRSWVEAGSLLPGEHLRTDSGTDAVVVSFTTEATPQAMWDLTVDTAHSFFVGSGGVLVHNFNPDECGGLRSPSRSPDGAGRNGAFRQAKRDAGVPVSERPARVGPNLDTAGKRVPGPTYEFPPRRPGDEPVVIRDDHGGHVYPDNPTQNRGPHFNWGRFHYDY
jgi:hypothetical protein